MKIKHAEVFKENFNWLMNDKRSLNAIYAGAVNELASYLTKDGTVPSPAEALEVFKSLTNAEIDPVGFIKFCSAIVRLCDAAYEVPDAIIPTSVTYLRSSFTDKAYEHFAKVYNGLTVSYGTDFKSICEDVYYDRTDACIMPLESSTDGLLMSFRHLLIKYELKISAICKVIQNDDSILTLALLSGNTFSSAGDIYEFYFPSVSSSAITDISEIIISSGGEIRRVNSVTSEVENICDLHVCAHVPPSAANALTYCFDALYPSHIVLGNYKIY